MRVVNALLKRHAGAHVVLVGKETEYHANTHVGSPIDEQSSAMRCEKRETDECAANDIVLAEQRFRRGKLSTVKVVDAKAEPNEKFVKHSFAATMNSLLFFILLYAAASAMRSEETVFDQATPPSSWARQYVLDRADSSNEHQASVYAPPRIEGKLVHTSDNGRVLSLNRTAKFLLLAATQAPRRVQLPTRCPTRTVVVEFDAFWDAYPKTLPMDGSGASVYALLGSEACTPTDVDGAAFSFAMGNDQYPYTITPEYGYMNPFSALGLERDNQAIAQIFYQPYNFSVQRRPEWAVDRTAAHWRARLSMHIESDSRTARRQEISVQRLNGNRTGLWFSHDAEVAADNLGNWFADGVKTPYVAIGALSIDLRVENLHVYVVEECGVATTTETSTTAATSTESTLVSTTTEERASSGATAESTDERVGTRATEVVAESLETSTLVGIVCAFVCVLCIASLCFARKRVRQTRPFQALYWNTPMRESVWFCCASKMEAAERSPARSRRKTKDLYGVPVAQVPRPVSATEVLFNDAEQPLYDRVDLSVISPFSNEYSSLPSGVQKSTVYGKVSVVSADEYSALPFNALPPPPHPHVQYDQVFVGGPREENEQVEDVETDDDMSLESIAPRQKSQYDQVSSALK